MRDEVVNEAVDEVERGGLEKLQHYLSLPGSSINAKGYFGKTVLHAAARTGNLQHMQFILDKGADVNIRDRRGKHALSIASSNQHQDAVKVLISSGSDLDMRDKYGRSALHWATMRGYKDILCELIAAGAAVVSMGNWHPLHEACKNGNLEFVKLLIDAGAVLNNEDNSPWNSPLYIACRQGHLDCVRYLIGCGADVNSFNAAGHTALHEAAFRGYAEVSLELLKNGANPNAENNQERTPLHEACMQGHVKCVIMLLDAKGNVSAQDMMYKTPLVLALRATHSKEVMAAIVTILLHYGANPSMSYGLDTETALEIALSMGQNDVWDVFQKFLDEPATLMQKCKVVIRKHIFWCEENTHKLCLPHTIARYIAQELIW